MSVGKIITLKHKIGAITDFLDFQFYRMTIVFGNSEIITSDDETINEIKEIFKRKREVLLLGLGKEFRNRGQQ